MSILRGSTFVDMEIAAAVPAACPIAKHGGITRMAANASVEADTQRPAARSPFIFAGTNIRYGIS